MNKLAKSNNLFGYAEAKAFCETHADERVRIIWKWLCEARNKNARWCDAINKAETKIKTYEDFLDENVPALIERKE